MSVRVTRMGETTFPDGERACYLDADLAGELHSFSARCNVSFARFKQDAKLPAGGRYLMHERQRAVAVRLGAIEV